MTEQRRLPAEEGLWAFVIGDMTMFGLFFNVFAYYRRLEPAVFDSGQATLDARIGLANTLILLTSSWLVVLALRAIRAERRPAAVIRFLGAFGCGLAFVALKLVEYGEKARAGITLTTDDFYMLYFMFTGIHLLHLLLGLAALSWLILRARSAAPAGGDLRLFEGGAIYWHMVDLLWVMLFPLIYLAR